MMAEVENVSQGDGWELPLFTAHIQPSFFSDQSPNKETFPMESLKAETVQFVILAKFIGEAFVDVEHLGNQLFMGVRHNFRAHRSNKTD